MAAAAKKVSGATLWIGTTAENGASDSYTQIGNVKTITMAGGGSYQMVDVTTISDTVKQTEKTVLDPFDCDVDIQEDPADAGQAAFKAAFENVTAGANFNFELRFSQGDKVRWKAKVTQHTKPVGSVGNVRMIKGKIEAQTVETYVAA